MKPQTEEIQAESHCNFCGRDVYNRCIHASQVKWCDQKKIVANAEVYGRYETEIDGKLVTRGIGPVDVIEPIRFERDSISFTQGQTTTKVWLSGLSI